MFDRIIRNGSIVDGAGEPLFVADIAITDGSISLISKDLDGAGRNEIDATGLVVAPGFIDIHSHSDISLFFEPHAQSKIMQGVTTEVVGNCGTSPAPLPVRSQYRNDLIRQIEGETFPLSPSEKDVCTWPSQIDYIQYLINKGISSNIIPLVGGATLRILAVGKKMKLELNDITLIRCMLAEELSRGVWGMSSGLFYVPESYYTKSELLELCEVLASEGRIWSVHMRDEGQQLFAAVDEVLDVAQRTGVSLQISHLKLEGKTNWGRTDELLGILHEAHDNGIDVSWDQYPYTAYGTNLISVIPPALREQGIDNFLKDLRNDEFKESVKEAMLQGTENWPSQLAEIDWGQIIISQVQYDNTLMGKTIEALAQERGDNPAEVILDLLITQQGAVNIVVPAMSEQDVRDIMQDSGTMISSDGKAVSPQGRYAQIHPHPRCYGAFPRVLGRYVREKGVLNLPEAIRKMTSLPASRLGLKDRGTIAEEQAADIVIFNPKTVVDCATFQQPARFPQGIEYVFVNGDVVVEEGQHTGRYPGKLLKR
jgi:N-acyl-D-amino-acid deacylase